MTPRLARMGPNTLVVYLIKPSRYDDDGYVIRHWRGVLPSNTLAVLDGLTEEVRARRALGGRLRWRVELVDESVQKVEVPRIIRVSRRRGTTVVACLVGVQSNQWARASDLAVALRAGGVTVLIGGFHVSGSLAMLPMIPPEIQRLLEAGVTVVAGEVEGRWEGILRDALRGTLKPIYNFLAEPPDLSAAPLPRINRRYLRRFVSPNFGTLDCGRGCPFDCSFCTVINVQGRAMRCRDVGRLLAAIRENFRRHRISYYFFTDDNFCRHRHWEQILDGLIRLRTEEGIRLAFMIQADTQSYKLPRFIEKAKAAGCSQVFIGLESMNPANLAAAGKRQNLVADLRALMAAYRRHQITVHVAYIIGFPWDTPASVREDLRRVRQELGPQQASFFILTPLPGSRDHLACVRQGVALEPDLNRYDSFHVTTPHPRMTDGEWRSAYEEAWASFYHVEHLKAILRRASPAGYWGVFCNFLWYKNAIQVEGGHPMLHGFVRLKDRRQRRPGFPLETRRQYLRRRLKDVRRTLRGWLALALEMEEAWLETRHRGPLEQQVVAELQRRTTQARHWRDLRAAELQHAYRRAAVALRRAAPAPPKIAIPPRFWLWMQQRNLFAHSLTASRQAFRQFWRETWAAFRRGQLHRVNVSRATFTLAQEVSLFLVFAGSFFGQLLAHLAGRRTLASDGGSPG